MFWDAEGRVCEMINTPTSVFNLSFLLPKACLRNSDVRFVTPLAPSTAGARVAITSRCHFNTICERLGQPAAFVNIRSIVSLSAESCPGTEIGPPGMTDTLRHAGYEMQRNRSS